MDKRPRDLDPELAAPPATAVVVVDDPSYSEARSFPLGNISGGSPSALARWDPSIVEDDLSTLTYVSFSDAWDAVVAVGGGVIELIGESLIAPPSTFTSDVPMEIRGRKLKGLNGVGGVRFTMAEGTLFDVASLVLRDIDWFPFSTGLVPAPPTLEPCILVREELKLYGCFFERLLNLSFVPPFTFEITLYPAVHALGDVQISLFEGSRWDAQIRGLDDPIDSEVSLVEMRQGQGSRIPDDWLVSTAVNPGFIRRYGATQVEGTVNPQTVDGDIGSSNEGLFESLALIPYQMRTEATVRVGSRAPHPRLRLQAGVSSVEFFAQATGGISYASFEIFNDTGAAVSFIAESPANLHPASALSASDGALCLVRNTAFNQWLVKVIP